MRWMQFCSLVLLCVLCVTAWAATRQRLARRWNRAANSWERTSRSLANENWPRVLGARCGGWTRLPDGLSVGVGRG